MHRAWIMGALLLFGTTIGGAAEQQTYTMMFDEAIDALSVGFETDTPDLHLSFYDGTTWSAWAPLAIEKEFDPLLRESNLVTFPTPVSHISFKGRTRKFALHPIRVSHDPIGVEFAALGRGNTPRILSRRMWGADESFLYDGSSVSRSDRRSNNLAPSSNDEAQSARVEECKTLQEKYPAEFQTVARIDRDPGDRILRWTREYSKNVRLLVVHHTEQKITGDPRPPVERVRALYAYHANSRGWGDIGYNYVIDETGTIYEGRGGGDNVVGGHTYCHNVGSIGVALLGNFEVEQPPLKQIQSLQWLISHLAKKYHLDLRRDVRFHGKTLSPISPHSDLVSTVCPGWYLRESMDRLRSNVIRNDLFAGIAFQQKSRPSVASSPPKQRAGTRFSRLTNHVRRTLARRGEQERRQRQQNQNTIQSAPMSGAPDIGSPKIRIRLTNTSFAMTVSMNEGVVGATRVSGEDILLKKEHDACVASRGQRIIDRGIVRMLPSNKIFTVHRSQSSRRFRGTLECRVIDGELVIINELPLEQYLLGLAEEPDSEPLEKQKAFAIAARSYALHYLKHPNGKFPGKPWHGTDTATEFQLYGGLDFEKRNPQWVHAVEQTAGAVLMVEQDILRAAYFSSDDGRTRSPGERGWRNFPHADVFRSKPDPWCQGETLNGHGVGMSGCGARGQALMGKSAEAILNYYYPGTTLQNIY